MERFLLDTLAVEEGTYPALIAFRDEDGDEITPDTITWTLVDPDETVINDRLNIPVVTPAADITIVLSGDDLAKETELFHEPRILHIHATYTSDLGAALPWNKDFLFYIEESLINASTGT